MCAFLKENVSNQTLPGAAFAALFFCFSLLCTDGPVTLYTPTLRIPVWRVTVGSAEFYF